MKTDKNDVVAFAGTLIIHIIAAIILFFMVLRTIVPDEEEGVMVLYNPVGLFEPVGQGSQVVENIPSQSDIIPSPSEAIINQDQEETAYIADSLGGRQREEERSRREEAERIERERIEAEAQRQRESDISNRVADQVAGAFGTGNADNGSQGYTEGAGNQGSPFGNSDTGANSGVGGMGEFSLSGRTIRGGGLPRPAYTMQEEGRIVIDITVDPKGNVIIAEIGKGTNIDNSSMRSSALEAAKLAKFNSIKGTNNQSGTITYRYTLK